MSDTILTEQPPQGLSEELVFARHALGEIERRRERDTLREDIVQTDYLCVIANALVSIATSLETSTVAARLAEIGDVLETRTMSVAVSEFGA